MDVLDWLCIGMLGVAIISLALKLSLHWCERALGFQWQWLNDLDRWVAYPFGAVLAVSVVVLLVRNFPV